MINPSFCKRVFNFYLKRKHFFFQSNCAWKFFILSMDIFVQSGIISIVFICQKSFSRIYKWLYLKSSYNYHCTYYKIHKTLNIFDKLVVARRFIHFQSVRNFSFNCIPYFLGEINQSITPLQNMQISLANSESVYGNKFKFDKLVYKKKNLVRKQ